MSLYDLQQRTDAILKKCVVPHRCAAPAHSRLPFDSAAPALAAAPLRTRVMHTQQHCTCMPLNGLCAQVRQVRRAHGQAAGDKGG